MARDSDIARWTIRDLDGQVLRDYRQDGSTWTVERDYVRANGRLLAAEAPSVTHHTFRLGRYLGPDPITGESRTPQSWNRYGYTRGNPVAYTDPTGMIVRFMTPEAKTDFCVLIGTNCDQKISMATDRTITVTTSATDIASNEALQLLKEMSDSQNVYGVWVGNELPIDSGGQPLGNAKGELSAANFSTTDDHRTLVDKKPPQGFDGVVGVAIDYESFTEGATGRPTHRPSAVFHEMAENQQRTDKLKQYKDSHAAANIREQKLRAQQPNLKQYAPGGGPVIKYQKP